MSRYKRWTDEQLIEACKQSSSIRQVIQLLGLIPAGGNYSFIKLNIERLEINIAHFKGKGWNKNLHVICNPSRPLNKILKQDSHYRSSRLRERLIKENYFKHECMSCKGTNWLNGPIPLELDHINGIKYDNRIENLRLLCPNCHALTPTYKGKNIGRYDNIEKPKKKKRKKKRKAKKAPRKKRPKNKCVTCDKALKSFSANKCRPCYLKSLEVIDWPKTIDLQKMLYKASFLSVAKILGVSDNAIRKRLKNHK